MYNTSMKRTRKILIIVIAAIVLFCAVTYIVTPLVIVRPSYNKEAAKELALVEMEEMFAEKRPLNIPLVEDIKIQTHQGTLYGYRLHRQENTYTGARDLLLYFGGYDEDAATAALRFLKQMTEDESFPEIDVAVIDWPGYGVSEGRTTDDAIREASVSAFRYFKAQESVGQIFVMGYSFGTGPAVYTASCCDADGLILLAPYESIYDLYNSVTPVFYGPMRWLISFQMDTGKYAEETACHPLLIASKSDSRIPYKASKALAVHFPDGCEFISKEGIAHGDLISDSSVWLEIERYLEKLR